ncbi:MAG: hypothetical protein U1F23_01515 [Lysobacterales bacterium]
MSMMQSGLAGVANQRGRAGAGPAWRRSGAARYGHRAGTGGRIPADAGDVAAKAGVADGLGGAGGRIDHIEVPPGVGHRVLGREVVAGEGAGEYEFGIAAIVCNVPGLAALKATYEVAENVKVSP